MKRAMIAIVALAIVLAGCQETVVVDADKYLTGTAKDEKLPDLQTPKEVKIPFFINDSWASELSKFVPVFEKPEFLPESQPGGKPEIFQNELSLKATDINASTYHNADPRDVYAWMDKSFTGFGFQLNKSAGKDPKVYIPVDEHGYFLLVDGERTMQIHVWKMSAYPGWSKVTYEGTTNKDCGCEKKSQ